MSTSDYDREKLEERLAKLSGGVAKVNVGAATESEMKEKKARVEDALHATRAAVEEGILPGGGVALLRASTKVSLPSELTHDEKVGYNIVLRACRSPAVDDRRERRPGRRHRLRAGPLECQGQQRLQRRDRRVRRPGQGGRHRPDQGRREPRWQNAASVATLLLTSDALIADKPKDEKGKGGGGHGGDYDMY